VKLKMADNSLFAVLLRSPWWASLSVAVVLSLLSGTFMPEGYKLVGAMATAPFVVISVMAARRQWREPAAEVVAQRLDEVKALPWPTVLERLHQGFQRDGYTPSETSPPAGSDLAIEKRGAVTLVSARKWKAARTGIETLRALQAAREAIDAEHAACIALAEPTEAALDFARSHGIRLIRSAELAKLLMPVR
jgi:restriction system protein